MEIKLHRVGRLIAECWDTAERDTALLILKRHPCPNEEEITFLLEGALRATIEEASDRRRFQTALATDIANRVGSVSDDGAHLAKGVIARVIPHGRWHEGHRSGADLGVLVARPYLTFDEHGVRVEIKRRHARALLAQAKLWREGGPRRGSRKWGRLTKPQERLALPHLGHYSLLLYRLTNEAGTALAQLGWQLCQRHTIPEIQEWLQSSAFPEEITSERIIARLVAGTTGTTAPAVIETIVDPSSARRRTIEIEVDWRDGAAPPRTLQLHRRLQQQSLAVQRR